MESDSSEDRSEERLGSYNVSADVSESETSNGEVDEGCGASTSAGFSSFGASSETRLTPTLGLPLVGGKDVVVWNEKLTKSDSDSSDVEMMKERFAKLLLGEDMSGGGKGVCTALAISNAITNLSASVFGALWKLEPMARQKLTMWCREMEWFLSVSDSIVELVPSIQQSPGGGMYEIMATRQRADLYMNLPALKKLDAMLISILDEFHDTEFWYVDGAMDADDYHKSSSELFCERPSVRQEGKWWLPCPQVPGRGLSEDSRKMLQQSRDCANQILKAAMAINSNVLAEMDIPSTYIENLPKNGRDCLGDVLYNYITAEQFSPQHISDCLDLSTEHNALDVANKLEGAVHVWKLKERKKQPDIQKSKRKSWGGKVKGFATIDVEKNQFLGQRAETLLSTLRHRFPGLPQTALDMSKIQYNKDVGHSILESYSRVMESLAFNIIARIDDVLYVDNATRCSAAAESLSIFNRFGSFNGLPVQKRISPSPFSIQPTPYSSPPFATPFGLSPPTPSSPTRPATPQNKTATTGLHTHKLDKVVPSDASNGWLYAGRSGTGQARGEPDTQLI